MSQSKMLRKSPSGADLRSKAGVTITNWSQKLAAARVLSKESAADKKDIGYNMDYMLRLTPI